MKRYLTASLCGALLISACASPPPPKPDPLSLQKQVEDTERAFAHTMADRDFGAFRQFLSADAIFYSNDTPTRGPTAIAAGWKRFFETPEAPFSWAPDHVEVVDSGTLAMSTGPVYDPSGKLIGRFRSIWRQEAPGTWRIVFDKGDNSCEAASKPN